MFKTKTVFVLGAGAGFDFEFPLGEHLCNDIVTMLRNVVGDGAHTGPSHSLDRYIRNNFQRDGLIKAAALADSLAGRDSIDDCLATFSSDEVVVKIGKFAIVSSLAHRERKSRVNLLTKSSWSMAFENKFNPLWTYRLLNMIVNVPKEEFLSVFRNLTIINFNYDRSIYVILMRGLMRAFTISEDEAWSAVSKLEIYHPYGFLGEIRNSINLKRSWGLQDDEFETAANLIKVYTETGNPASCLHPEASSRLAEAHRIVFLGFGFHEQNMKLLSVEGIQKERGLSHHQEIFATTTEMKDAKVDAAKEWIHQCFNTRRNADLLRFGTASDNCKGFLDAHDDLIVR